MHIQPAFFVNISLIECAEALITSFMPWKPDRQGGSVPVSGITTKTYSHEVKAEGKR